MSDCSIAKTAITHPVFEIERDGDSFRVDVPAGWTQGRGAFGGLVVGWLARAAERVEGDPHRLVRTLSAEIVGPVRQGPATIHVSPLRVGNGISTYAARLVQAGQSEDETLAHAVVSLGRTRVTDREFAMTRAPAVPGPSDVELLPVQPPLGPEFAQHLAFRPVRGTPMSAPGAHADGGAATVGYVRFKELPPVVDTAYLAAIADAHWPATLATEEALRPMATLSFTLDIVTDPRVISPDETFLVATRALAGHHGYVVEERHIYTSSGVLVALNRQTFVIIK